MMQLHWADLVAIAKLVSQAVYALHATDALEAVADYIAEGGAYLFIETRST